MTTRRRRAASVAALVGLTVALVSGGAISAQADGGLEITTPASIEYTGASIEITGTATTDNMGFIDVTVNGAPGCTIAYGDPWGSCVPGIVDPGTYDLVASQDGGLGPARSDALTLTVTPPAPTYAEGDRDGWNGQSLDFNGATTAPDSTVTVSIPGVDSCTDGPHATTGTAWNCNLDIVEVAPGPYTIEVTQTSGGVTGAATTATLTVHPGDDGLYISAPDSAPTGTPFTISGTKNPEVSGVLVRAGTDAGAPVLCNIPASADATWSCTPTIAAPAYVEVTAYQGARTWTRDVTVGTFPAPTVDNPDPDEISAEDAYNLDYVVSGTVQYPGSANSTVHVEIDGYPVACGSSITEVVPDEEYTWSCDLDTEELPPGQTYTYWSRQDDFGGMTGTPVTHSFYVGQPLPAELGVDSPAEGEERPYMDLTKIVGHAPSREVGVDLMIDGTFEGCENLAVDIDGDWRCDIALAEGPHTVQAWQSTSSSAEVSFEVVEAMPAPEPDDDDVWFAPGTTDAVFTGTTTYAGASTRISVIEDLGDGYTEVVAETICPDSAGRYTCHLDLSDLVEGGWYSFEAQHVLASDHEISGLFATGDLNIGTEPAPGTPPTLSCAFSPAGARITAPAGDWLTRLYSMAPNSSGDSLVDRLPCSGNAGNGFSTGARFTFTKMADCLPTCVGTALAPGYYDVYVSGSGESEGDGSYDYVFRIPETPVITTSASTGTSVILRGTGTPGDGVRVERVTGSSLCTTTVNGSGGWACAFPASTTSVARAIAVDPASGGLSAYTARRTIAVAETPVAPTEVDPALISWFLEFGGDLSDLKPGQKITLTISGMPEGTELELWIHSTPRLLGTAVGTGAPMAMTVTVPTDIENGHHEIVMTGVTPLGTHYNFTSDAMVSGGVDPVKDGPSDEQPVADGEGGSGGSDRTDPGAPSGISGSLVTLGEVAADPLHVAVAGGLALALLFLVALPTELLNSSLSSNGSRLGRGYAAVDGALTRARDWFIGVTRSRALATAVLLVIVSVIYGFVDPGFGFDLVSLRLVLSLALAYFVLTFGSSWITGLIARRAWGISGVIEAQPTIILFALVGVIVSRVLDFSPGFLVGVAVGLELIQASKRISARAVLLQLGVVVGLTLAAWIGYSLFVPGADFGGMLTEDALVAITAEGLTGAMIAIFPLRFLDGRELWESSKLLWGAAFVVIGTAFGLLVLPSAIEGTEVGDLGVWLVVFAVFGAISLGAWFFFARAERREEAAERAKEKAGA